ncbi:MAG: type II secretion system protein GspG [Luteolibacter sp.]
MKTTPRKGSAGFTLIELMAVITIIVILAGLVVGGLGYVTEKQASSKAKVQIALLSKALEEYKLDNGAYPATANTTTGTGLTADLYQALFYEGYDYNKQSTPPTTWTKKVNGVDFPKSTKIYLADLDPTSTKQGWVDPVTGTNPVPPASTTIKDPWGNEYRYRTGKSPSGSANSATMNPDFDLWSTGKNGLTNPAGTSATDKKNNADDIKNF